MTRKEWTSVEPGIRELRDGNPSSFGAPHARDVMRILLIGAVVWVSLHLARGLWPHELRHDLEELRQRVDALEKP